MALDNIRRDLKVGFRVLLKEKAFCALAVTVLALGICGVTTMFSVVNGVMLRGFSLPNETRLMGVQFIDPTTANPGGFNNQIFAMDYVELLPVQQSFEKMAAYLNGSTVNVTFGEVPRRYTGAYATDQFLSILGVAPMMGRDFTPADNQQGAEKVALISYGVWQRDFAGAGNIVGTAVRINGKPATIIGVMPQGFAFPINEEIWLPLFSEFPPRPRNDPNANSPAVLGLLKPGVTIDQATAEFTTLARRFAAAYPDTNKQFNTGQVQRLIDNFTPPVLKGMLLTMLAFCVGVLLIACVNVMNMQFARATLRAKELAIRSSLGGSRGRLLRQMLTESLLVASIGAAVGIGLAYLSTGWLDRTVRSLDNPPPAYIYFDVSPIVLAVTVLATIAAALFSGLLPAWMSSRTDTNAVLRDGGRGNTRRGMTLVTRGLVVFQIVVTCVLLIGSLLQMRSIVNQQSIDFGYDADGIMSARMGLMAGDYPTPETRKVFLDRLMQQLRENTSFGAVGYTTRFRMVFSGNGPVEIDGKTYAARGDRLQANFEQVSPGFFDVTAQRLLDGRNFTDEDLDSRQPVAIVNLAFAEKHFGRESPLNRRFRTTNPEGQQAGPWRTIVGVVSNVRMLGPFNNPNVDNSGFYVPFYSTAFGPAPPGPFVAQFATVLVKPRPGQTVESAGAMLRREVAKADPNLPLYFMGTPRSQVEVFVAQNRIIAMMFSIFGVVAVVLASVGIYGVMSFSVNQRTQEFGVRMALGANATRILSMVLRQGAWQIAIGLTLGIGLAYTVSSLFGGAINATLFGVTATDWLTYVAVASLVTAVSLFATFVPAKRATRVRPIIALRAD